MKVRLRKLGSLSLSQGALFVVCLLVTHVLNLGFNIFLGIGLDAEDYGVVALVTSFLYFTNIVFLALVATVSHTVAYLDERIGAKTGAFVRSTRHLSVLYALFTSIAWLAFTPVLTGYFQLNSALPLLAYAPIFSVGVITGSNRGFLQGRLQFIRAGIIIMCEAVSKLSIAAALVVLGYGHFMYIAIPLSIALASVVSVLLTQNALPSNVDGEEQAFPIRFFVIASLGSLSTMAFLGIDTIMVKHYFTPVLAGQYALLSLTGKTIYFMGSLFNNLLIPLVGKDLGRGKNPAGTFYVILTATLIAVACGFICFGLFGGITAPLLFGRKALPIVDMLPAYSAAIAAFTVATSITTFHLAKKDYVFPVLSIVIAIGVAVAIMLLHSSLKEIVNVLFVGGLINLVSVLLLHLVWTNARGPVHARYLAADAGTEGGR